MAAGFKACMNYHDGHGSGTLPNTGQTVYKQNEPGKQVLTPGPEMNEESNPLLGELFGYDENQPPLEKGVSMVAKRGKS